MIGITKQFQDLFVVLFVSELAELMKTMSIQSFGHLIVAESSGHIVAASENLLHFLQTKPSSLLNRKLDDVLVDVFSKEQALNIQRTIREIISGKTARQLITVLIAGQNYYLDIYVYEGLLYLEWEEQQSNQLLTSEMHTEGLLNELPMDDIVQSLCRSTRKLLGYDRAVVLQLSESGHSSIVAEAVDNGLPSMKSLRFSPSFLSNQDISCFDHRAYLYFPRLNEEKQELLHQETSVNLSASSFEVLADKFKFYLHSIGARSAIFYKISMEGKMWGLLAAMHSTQMDIDLQKRKLCHLIVQNTANRMESKLRDAQFQSMELLKGAQNLYKTAFIDGDTLNKALVDNLTAICEVPRADGVALFFHGQVFTEGNTPDESTIREVAQFVRAHSKKPIFKDSNFRASHQRQFGSPLDFAGLASLEIARDQDHYLLWFRGETLTQEIDLKKIKSNKENPSSHDYHLTYETIRDTAIAWDGNDLAFIAALDKTINDAILSRNKEQNRSLEELNFLNSELQLITSTLSHDLKNPLAIVKMGVQYLKAKGDIPRDKQLKWLRTISSGIADLESLIDNTVKIGKERNRTYSRNSVAMSALIKKLANDALSIYQSPNCSLEYGELHSICGDKGILHQIFMNLIGNAVKYSAKAPAPKVGIYSSREGDEVHYTIKDNGIGIPKKDIHQIFKIYRRAENAMQFKGSGIGVSLVKRLVENLNGTIHVSSVEGEGTSFKLIFPSDCS